MAGTVLGFDYGRRYIGIAVGQTLTGSSNALKSLIVPASGRLPWSEIEALCTEWNPGHLVVGLPCHLDGNESNLAREARGFAKRLERRLQRPVSLWNEALSTEAAREALANERHNNAHQKRPDRARLNAEAARTILEGWLTATDRGTTEPSHD
ncbi:MAG: Holliday junction resolvase RuvX [Gammaproteobacteria bacterium]